MEKQNILYQVSQADLHTELEVFGRSLLDAYRAEQEAKNKTNELLTAGKTMARLGVSRSTLFRWEKDGYLKPVRIGAKVMYNLSDVEAIERGRV